MLEPFVVPLPLSSAVPGGRVFAALDAHPSTGTGQRLRRGRLGSLRAPGDSTFRKRRQTAIACRNRAERYRLWVAPLS